MEGVVPERPEGAGADRASGVRRRWHGGLVHHDRDGAGLDLETCRKEERAPITCAGVLERELWEASPHTGLSAFGRMEGAGYRSRRARRAGDAEDEDDAAASEN